MLSSSTRPATSASFEELLAYARGLEQCVSRGVKADRAGLTRNRPDGS
ncbi:hypothetical protein [Mesorhizobium sp.]|nr:hypothetical protein [Mesorhizobium sp.]